MRAYVLVLLLLFYGFILLRNWGESERRSLRIQAGPGPVDHVSISILVLDVDPQASRMTARIGFRLAGSLARDEVTPAADLKLFLNNMEGPQEVDFPQGRRMNPIVAVFPLDGDVNRYPLDRHATSIRMLMTRPSSQPPLQPATSNQNINAPGNPSDTLAVGALALQGSETVTISPALSASIPGLKFEGNLVAARGEGPTSVELRIARADQVIAISFVVMLLMFFLALSLFLMALRAVTSEDVPTLMPLSLAVTLLFGLPALREVQPGVPPVGGFWDYVVFLWAEMMVALSAIFVMWAWLRSTPAKPKASQ
jgi:hypothetical protein